jgi:hypothetical protein
MTGSGEAIGRGLRIRQTGVNGRYTLEPHGPRAVPTSYHRPGMQLSLILSTFGPAFLAVGIFVIATTLLE